jgi:ribonucleoside-diphosphate reductase alpha chain
VSEIDTVALSIVNVDRVGNNINNVNNVAANATNINTVASNNNNVTTVAGIATQVQTVAGIDCNVTTVAPTGTISIIAGCSSGLEPLFAVAFMRNQAGVMMPDVNEDFVSIAKAEGWYSEALMEKIAKTGTVKHDEVPERVQRIFNTANNISPEYHIRMQAAFQAHCDSAISKTTNFAYTATQDDVRAIYELAFNLKCKGVTVYRDGSRDNQVLSTGATQEAAAKREEVKAAGSADAVKGTGRDGRVMKEDVAKTEVVTAKEFSAGERTLEFVQQTTQTVAAIRALGRALQRG